VLDGAVMMPPQPPPTNDCLPANAAWRELFQASFIGPLALLKAAISVMQPDPAHGRRSKIVIVSGMSSVQVLGHCATSNVLRCSWLAEAKTLAFALGDRGIHVNTLSLGGTLTPDYSASLERRALNAGVTVLCREWPIRAACPHPWRFPRAEIGPSCRHRRSIPPHRAARPALATRC